MKSQSNLLEETDRLVEVKQKSGMILIAILMFMIFLSVFDTQALSIFHRQKELGILMALGLTTLSNDIAHRRRIALWGISLDIGSVHRWTNLWWFETHGILRYHRRQTLGGWLSIK